MFKVCSNWIGSDRIIERLKWANRGGSPSSQNNTDARDNGTRPSVKKNSLNINNLVIHQVSLSKFVVSICTYVYNCINPFVQYNSFVYSKELAI